MQDLTLKLLLAYWQQITQKENSLWFADENSHEILPLLASDTQHLIIVSNRYDVYLAAKALGLRSYFNDVDFRAVIDAPIEHLFIRISKEKPVTHHAINQALNILSPTGHLYLAGHKNEGIKTYAQKASTYFLHADKLIKNNDAYSIHLDGPRTPEQSPLPDNNYRQLRSIGNYGPLTLISKPGIFGFEKIDEGSALLLTCVKEYLDNHNIQPQKILDLGCGYGLLALAAASWGAVDIVATDNNAAALSAISANAEQSHIKINIIADDAGQTITEKFDVVLCNPPFHQGFSISGDLTAKFLRSASHRLSKNGTAFFVVNSFIGVEKKADAFFSKQTLIVNNQKFKVLAFSK